MKKLLTPIIILFLLFSFYFTDKVIYKYQELDPIMQTIKDKENKYTVNSINATIIDNNIIPGKYGKSVNYKKSYTKMKQYGKYNETLTEIETVKPTISIEDNYSKYIIKGNETNYSISLVFTINENNKLDQVLNILKDVPATFFIDGKYLEANYLTIKSNKNHEYEILSYDTNYNEALFKTSISYLENITKSKTKYCYTEKDNTKLLNICTKLKLHTIKPSIIINKNIYKEVKNNLSNGLIIKIDLTDYNLKYLQTSVNYIKSKGYNIVLLKELLQEKNN